MCVPVFGPKPLMGRDAGPFPRLTSIGKGGCSWDGTIMPRKKEEIWLNKAAGLRQGGVGWSGSRGVRRVARLLAVVFIVIAINLDTVESASIEAAAVFDPCRAVLIELPSGFRCTWNKLPHLVQFMAIFMMVVLLYGVNRLFDKADEAVSTRLSCATAALLHERKHHHAPGLPKPPPNTKPRLQEQRCASCGDTGNPQCFGHGRGVSPLGQQQQQLVRPYPGNGVFDEGLEIPTQ
ncbi:unnamed protein product [Ectocarpus sp. 13 AM-2016]